MLNQSISTSSTMTSVQLTNIDTAGHSMALHTPAAYQTELTLFFTAQWRNHEHYENWSRFAHQTTVPDSRLVLCMFATIVSPKLLILSLIHRCIVFKLVVKLPVSTSETICCCWSQLWNKVPQSLMTQSNKNKCAFSHSKVAYQCQFCSDVTKLGPGSRQDMLV